MLYNLKGSERAGFRSIFTGLSIQCRSENYKMVNVCMCVCEISDDFLTCVWAQVHGELAGVAAGVRADLALEGPLVVVHAQVLLQAAAVRRGVRAVLTLVRLLPRVWAAVQVQLVPPAEALMAQFTLVWPVAWTTTGFYSSSKTHWWDDKGISSFLTGVSQHVPFHVLLAILGFECTA